MNLVYQGKNSLVDSAVRRATQVINSSFFQKHLLEHLDNDDAQLTQQLLHHINTSTHKNLIIHTYWNVLKRDKITLTTNPDTLRINLAHFRKSRGLILEQIVRNYTLLEFKKLKANFTENASRDEILASRISSLANVYA